MAFSILLTSGILLLGSVDTVSAEEGARTNSNNNNVVFDRPQLLGQITPSGAYVSRESVAVSGGSTYVAWRGSFASNPNAIIFRKSSDDAKTFGEPVLLGAAGEAGNVKVAASGDNVYVVWSSSSADLQAASNHFINFRVSSDRGNSFGNTTVLSSVNEGISSDFPAVWASGSKDVYVAWTDTDKNDGTTSLRFVKSSDAGRTFGTEQVVTSVPSTDLRDGIFADIFGVSGNKKIHSSSPHADDLGGNNGPNASNEANNNDKSSNLIYLTWSENSMASETNITHIFFKKSSDGGQSFGKTLLINNPTFLLGGFPSVWAGPDASTVYVVWEEGNEITAAMDVFISKSSDGGDTFGPPAKLTHYIEPSYISAINITSAFGPKVLRSDSATYITWAELAHDWRLLDPGTNIVHESYNIDIGQLLEDNDTKATILPSIMKLSIGDSGMIYGDSFVSGSGRALGFLWEQWKSNNVSLVLQRSIENNSDNSSKYCQDVLCGTANGDNLIVSAADSNSTTTTPMNPKSNIVDALAGDDAVYDDAGFNLTIYGHAGNDIIHGGPGKDVIFGDIPSGFAPAKVENPDWYFECLQTTTTTAAFSVDNKNHEGMLNDNDIIYAGNDGAQVFGGGGDDVIYGGQGADIICGNNGNDIYYGQAGNDYIIDSGGNGSLMYGGAGDDLLVVYSGQNNLLYGGEGNDHLVGNGGNYVMYGGPGADVFECGSGGRGTIVDYNPGEGDTKLGSCYVANG